MTGQCELSVVIPAYREAENLRLLLPRLTKVLEKLAIVYEVLVVDTRLPQDETCQVCHECGVCCLPRVGGNDYGDAVRTGLAHGKGKYILFMDADGSHTPEFIPNLWRHAKDMDVVVASRYVEGGGTENPRSLILMSRFLNFVYSVVLGLRCRDVSNSFKLYRGDLVRALTLRCRHFDIVEELMMTASIRAGKLRIMEVPFLFKKRLFGETKRNLPLFIVSFYVTLINLLRIRIGSKRQ